MTPEFAEKPLTMSKVPMKPLQPPVLQMLRYYGRAVLLVESSEKFRKKRVNGGPFQGELSRRSTDTRSLLCQLVRHNPRLSVMWSMSPSHSADLFDELKVGVCLTAPLVPQLDQPNPDAEQAMAIRSDDLSAVPDAEGPAAAGKVNTVVRRSLQTILAVDMTELDRALRSARFGTAAQLADASAAALGAAGFSAFQAENVFNFFHTDFRFVAG